jgi:hypothetical protein
MREQREHMGYSETLLASGETIVRRAHQHWFVLVANARMAILALVASALLGFFTLWFGISGTLYNILGLIILVLFVAGASSSSRTRSTWSRAAG